MAPNSKNDDRYQFARAKSTWKPNFAQIGGFLYFGGHFGFKMAAIANQNDCHMVQHVLLPVNIHFQFAMAAILNQKWPPKYKNPPIRGKFGFHVDFALAN
jgi:hypothetical protein